MLGKKEADQIIRQRFGTLLKPMGFKWVGKADCFIHERDDGADLFVVGQVNYTTVQKIGCTMGIRFDEVEALRNRILGYAPEPARITIGTPLDYYAGRLLEWECESDLELEAAIDEIALEYLPKVVEHYESNRNPRVVLNKVDDRNGDQLFASGDEVFTACGVLILQWLYQREGFDERVAEYRRRFEKYVAEVMAHFETIVKWLRSHPEVKGQP